MEDKNFSNPPQKASQEERISDAKRKISQLLEERCRDLGREMKDVVYELNMPNSLAAEIKDGSLYEKTKKVFAQGYVMSLARVLKLNQKELLDLLNTVYQTNSTALGDDKRTFMSDYEKEVARQQRKHSLVKTSIPFVLLLIIFAAVIYWKIYLDVTPHQLLSGIGIGENLFNLSYTVGAFNNSPALVEEAAAEPDDLLEFSFTERCWLSVKDSGGREIVWQLYGPGEKVTLRGQPPFELVIGNARGTTVKYRGKEVRLPVDSGDNVARLTVP